MPAGRQRQFDREQALRNAMLVFWKKGFIGASLAELTSSMGINKPSMYAAFGNKEQLFVEATEYYLEHHASNHVQQLHASDLPLRQRIRNYMHSALASQCDSDGPRGCYISLCVSESASECFPAAAEAVVSKAQNSTVDYLRAFLEHEQTLGSLPLEINAAQLGLFLATVLHGTAAMARGGKTLAELEPMVDQALQSVDWGAQASEKT